MASLDKLPDVEDKKPAYSLERERTNSISSDKQGNTIVTQENGEVFTIDAKAERALVWKFDLRILPLLALMYLFNAL